MKNAALPTEREVRQALRAFARGYLHTPDEGDVQSLPVTSVAWDYVSDVLDRLRRDPADPRCRICGGKVIAPGFEHEACPKDPPL